ncbi:TerD family protein [Peribacillus sp. JNUCC 23]
MIPTLIRGQKADVTKNNYGLRKLSVGLHWDAQLNMEIDASAFILGQNGKITKEEDFIFYGQPVSSCGSVTLRQSNSGTDKQEFLIDLDRISTHVQKIAFSLTIHHAEDRKHFFQAVSNMWIRLVNDETKMEFLRFPITYSFTDESAIIVADLYRYSNEWKFNPVGAGYFGGLTALCQDFGIDVEPEITTTLVAEQKQVSPESQPIPAAKPIKIELKKKQSVNIKKSKTVTATLEWETDKDLDLYCYYVTDNGSVGKVYYRDLGSSSVAPYIVLDGDSQESGKETIRIFRPEALRYVMFAAYSAVSNGAGSFFSLRAKAVVDNHMGDVVIAPLLERNDNAYWVCIAHIDFTNPKEMKISHVESYSKDHSEASPVLYENGKFRMDVGPIEFKDEVDYDIYFGQMP